LKFSTYLTTYLLNDNLSISAERVKDRSAPPRSSRERPNREHLQLFAVPETAQEVSMSTISGPEMARVIDGGDAITVMTTYGPLATKSISWKPTPELGGRGRWAMTPYGNAEVDPDRETAGAAS
jgi:hypothetical protein